MNDHMSDPWDDEDRAIARALGVEMPPGDDAGIDADAVADYETVLAQLPVDAVAPRPGLEEDVVAAALARRPAAARALDGRRAPARRSAAPRWIAIGAAVVAAAVLVVVLAVDRPSPGTGSPGGRIAPAAARGSVEQVLAQPGTRTGVLRAAVGAVLGKVALGAAGQGYVYDRAAPEPASAQWLWLDTGSGAPALVGRMPASRTVGFEVRGDVAAIDGVFVSTENGTPTVLGPVRAHAELRPLS